jgi:hypothetical protein
MEPETGSPSGAVMEAARTRGSIGWIVVPWRSGRECHPKAGPMTGADILNAQRHPQMLRLRRGDRQRLTLAAGRHRSRRRPGSRAAAAARRPSTLPHPPACAPTRCSPISRDPRRFENDLKVGLRLSRLLTTADLEVVAYRGWIQVLVPTGEFRPPASAAREAMKAVGFASNADIARWDAAITALTADPPTVFFPIFAAVGRRP